MGFMVQTYLVMLFVYTVDTNILMYGDGSVHAGKCDS